MCPSSLPETLCLLFEEQSMSPNLSSSLVSFLSSLKRSKRSKRR